MGALAGFHGPPVRRSADLDPFGAASQPVCVPGGGGAVAVIAEEPLLPPVAAVIVAEPAPFPVTSPLVLTVATVVLSLDQAMTRPVSGLPAESFGVAVSCTV